MSTTKQPPSHNLFSRSNPMSNPANTLTKGLTLMTLKAFVISLLALVGGTAFAQQPLNAVALKALEAQHQLSNDSNINTVHGFEFNFFALKENDHATK